MTAIVLCGLLLLGALLPIIDPGFHERMEAKERARAASDTAATGSKESPHTAIDTSKLSEHARAYFVKNEEIAFDPASVKKTVTWAVMRQTQLRTARDSGNSLIEAEVKSAIKDEMSKIIGSEVVWDLDVNKVTDSQIIFDGRPWFHFPTGKCEQLPLYITAEGQYRPPISIAIGSNLDFAKALTPGSTISVKAKLVGLEISDGPVIGVVLANPMMSE